MAIPKTTKPSVMGNRSVSSMSVQTAFVSSCNGSLNRLILFTKRDLMTESAVAPTGNALGASVAAASNRSTAVMTATECFLHMVDYVFNGVRSYKGAL
jgi:hypothetical protein